MLDKSKKNILLTNYVNTFYKDVDYLDIHFGTKKLQKQCSSLEECTKKWGSECAKLIMRRLDDALASNNLQVLKSVHRRCHALTGDREGQWSLDVKHPFRLIFVPANDPIPKKQDGSLLLEYITVIKILEVIDTHG